MWYFSWLLGLGLALAFGILNALWFEIVESNSAVTLAAAGAALADSDTPHRAQGR